MRAMFDLCMRQQGEGPPLLCLHASGLGASQWHLLADHLPKRRLWMPDLAGHGSSPVWPAASTPGLVPEAELLWANLWALEQPVDILGHAYGAALALQMALTQPLRVRSLTLYEPQVFGILQRHEPWGEAWNEIEQVADTLDTLIDADQRPAATQLLCDYWGPSGAWQHLSEPQQASMTRRLPDLRRHLRAALDSTWGPTELSRLHMPIHLICGTRARPPVRRVCDLLNLALDSATLSLLPGAGPMGPLSHAPALAALLQDGLAEQACA